MRHLQVLYQVPHLQSRSHNQASRNFPIFPAKQVRKSVLLWDRSASNQAWRGSGSTAKEQMSHMLDDGLPNKFSCQFSSKYDKPDRLGVPNLLSDILYQCAYMDYDFSKCGDNLVFF